MHLRYHWARVLLPGRSRDPSLTICPFCVRWARATRGVVCAGCPLDLILRPRAPVRARAGMAKAGASSHVVKIGDSVTLEYDSGGGAIGYVSADGIADKRVVCMMASPHAAGTFGDTLFRLRPPQSYEAARALEKSEAAAAAGAGARGTGAGCMCVCVCVCGGGGPHVCGAAVLTKRARGTVVCFGFGCLRGVCVCVCVCVCALARARVHGGVCDVAWWPAGC